MQKQAGATSDRSALAKPLGRFGVVALVSRGSPRFYQDHSFLKHQRLQRLDQQRETAARLLEATVGARHRGLAEWRQARELHDTHLLSVSEAVTAKFRAFATMWQAATCIQKYLR